MSEAPIYEFGDVRLDLGRMVVSRNGRAIDLEPKTFDVLRFLIENRERLVGKDELLDVVWKDTFVTPNVLTRAVAQLRKAIGDDAHESRYVETVAKRGYRFIAPVVETAGQPRNMPDQPASIIPAALAPDAPVQAVVPPTSSTPPPHASAIPTAHPRRLFPLALVVGSLLAIIAVLGGMLAFRSSRAGAAAPASPFPSVRRVVGGTVGYNVSPSLSPDGRAIAFVSDRSGGLEIYVTGLVSGSREIAITSDGGQNMEPEWSPDGQWIAFHSQARGGVWIVPATGGVARQVADFGSGPSWSPDSQWLVFSSDSGNMAAQATLSLVRRDGTGLKPLTRLGAPEGGHHMPSWSHDGKYVLFACSSGTDTELWAAAVADGSVHRIAVSNGEYAHAVANPRFGPGDRAIIWAGRTTDGNGRIWKLTLAPGSIDPAGPAQPVLSYDAGYIDGLSIASDGSAVYGLYTEDSNLWAVGWPPRTAGADPTRLTQGMRNFRASYASDGRVAYVKAEVGQQFSIWTMNEDGSRQEPLVTDFLGFSPQWAPDAARVLVRASVNMNDNSFYWVDAATRRRTPLSFSGPGMAEARLSPDGKELAFHVIDTSGTMNVWIQSIAGGPRRQITFDKEAVSYPSWSPDGRSLAVEIKRGDDTFVGIVPAAGGPVRQLTFAHGQNWPNTWSPDGEWIAFAGARAGVWNVWAVSARTGETRQLTHITSINGYVRWPSWSPHGDRIVFERNQQAGGVWLTRLP